MTFFEAELRNILAGIGYPVRYIGNSAYISVGDVRIRVRFSTSDTVDNYDTLHMTAFNRREGEIDCIGTKICDIIGIKATDNPNFREGFRPHIWKGLRWGFEWPVYKPTVEDRHLLYETVKKYIEVFEDD